MTLYLNHRLNVHVFYDDTFNTRFGSEITTRINALFAIVRTIYSDPSLTTVVDPNIIQVSYQSGASWEATETVLRYFLTYFGSFLNKNKRDYVNFQLKLV